VIKIRKRYEEPVSCYLLFKLTWIIAQRYLEGRMPFIFRDLPFKLSGFVYAVMVAFLLLLIFLGTTIPTIVSLGNWAGELTDLLQKDKYYWIVFITTIIVGFKLVQMLYSIEISFRRYVAITIVLFVLALIARLWYALTFDQLLVSDFKTMWSYAVDTYNSGEFTPPIRPQQERTLASLVPLVMAFGTSTVVYKLANVVMIIVSALIVSVLTAEWVSYAAGVLVFIMVSLIPDTYFVSIIPSHDISGAFYVLCYVFIFSKIMKSMEKLSIKRIILYSLLLVLFGVLIKVQRNIYIVVIAVQVIIFSLYLTNRGNFTLRKISVVVVTTFVTFLLVKLILIGLVQGGVLISQENKLHINKYGGRVSHPHTFSNGRHLHQKAFYGNITTKIQSEEDTKSFYKSLVFSDLYYNISERPQNYMLRVGTLYLLGKQGRAFYFNALDGLDRDEQQEVNVLFQKMNSTAIFMLIPLLLVSSVYLIFYRRNVNIMVIYVIIFMSMMTLALGTISEAQPRYLYPGWFLWPIVIAWFLDSIITKKNKHSAADNVKPALSVSSLVVILLLLSGMYYEFREVFKTSDYRFLNMSEWTDVTCSKRFTEEQCQQSLVKFKDSLLNKQYSSLIFSLPDIPKKNDFVLISKKLPGDNDKKYTFSTFFKFDKWRNIKNSKDFFVSIRVNKAVKQVISPAISESGFQFIKIEDITPVDGEIQIDFILRARDDKETDSWYKASKVIFKFTNLREQKDNNGG